MSLVLPEDYGQLCAQQPGTKTSRGDVNKDLSAGRYPVIAGGIPVTRYQSLEINYCTTASNNETNRITNFSKNN